MVKQIYSRNSRYLKKNSHKKNIGLIVVILLILAISSSSMDKRDVENADDANRVCIEDTCFDVDVANSLEERKKGLMEKKELDEDKGMLFIYDEPGFHSFWMKNNHIPLDIIWIDKNLEIIYIFEDAQPCEEEPCPLMNPSRESYRVLEINSGLVKEHDIEEGQKVKTYIENSQ
ncbi:MAG: DUF192 domain-containing protein [Candidatus Woesearchaeota archaeon]